MASADHLLLSNFIKSVHQNLREATRKDGSEDAWQRHCEDQENLKKYAEAMQKLACQHWESNNESKTGSRIQWTVGTCVNYFTKDIHKFRSKEKEISVKISNCTIDFSGCDDVKCAEKLKLLDVGSCYNPFNTFELFDVTAIDIAPAKNEVIKCDFLSVIVQEDFVLNGNELLQLPKGYFNVVVFSLLLEYLPTPKQRQVCCEKAYNLLKQEGLLVIITPDSNHVGANAKYMKSWRYVLAKMGFSRIKYEKLPHIHCMAFRKTISKAVATRWAELHTDAQLFDELYIPQDFNKSSDKQNVNEKNSCSKRQDDIIEFSELPQCDIFQ